MEQEETSREESTASGCASGHVSTNNCTSTSPAPSTYDRNILTPSLMDTHYFQPKGTWGISIFAGQPRLTFQHLHGHFED